jgi:branched-chain amino acid transport system substrate-binding protein
MLAADGDIPLADGVLAVVAMPQAGGYAGQPTGLASGRYAEASASIDRVIQASDTPDMRASDGYHLAAYAAGEVLAQAQAQAESSGQALGNALVEGTFTTALGDVRFGTDQHFDSAIFTAVVWQDGRFSAIGAGVSE